MAQGRQSGSKRIFIFTTSFFMLYVVAGILLVLWLAGLITSYDLGGFIHLFLVVSIIIILVSLIRDERRS